MTASEQYDLSHDPTFLHRVQMIIQKSAIAVAAEDPATVNHSQRVAYGNKVLMNPSGYSELMAQGVVTNAAISAASTDSDIEFTINSQWNAYAISA